MITLLSISNLFATTYYSKSAATDANSKDSWNTQRDGSGSRPSSTSTFTSGHIFIIQSGHSMTTSASWSISGTGAELNIESTATLNIQSSHVLTVQGQLVSNGSISGYSLILTGTDSAIDTLSSATLQRLTTNQTSNLVMISNVTVSSILTMTVGNITTGNYILTLGTGTGAGSTTIGSLSYTSGKIIGSFKRWFGTATVNNVQFPVGTASQSRMVALSRTNVTTGGSLTAKFVASDPGNNNSSYLTDNTYTVDRFTNQGYWEITKNTADGTFAGNYSLDMETTGFAGILDITKLRIIKRPDAVSAWVLEGTHTNGVGTTVKRTGLSNFSQFTLGGNATDNPLSDSPLPVSLSSFTSSVKNNSVTLNWSTVSEINNKGFEIERKESNSSNYTKVGFVDGKGTTNQVSNYSFADNKLNSGNYSYRIKQVDFNGNFEYFSLNSGIEIGAPKKFTLAQNYPNPFNPSTKIDYEIPSDSKVNITIYDISGKEVQQIVNEYQKAGYYTAQFNASRLSSGTYFYKLTSGIDILTKKMTLIK
ncbi:MAG: T9SS type A sorting domain-containing protein [Ignavibacteriae bacterium]|nr:T9SS type A sorting domain-containing protein [Ignavibacteriota bacterium]